jgi:ankyrin repeat protein
MDASVKTEHDNWNLLHRLFLAPNVEPSAQVASFLIEAGVDVNARDRRLWTPLHFAARAKSTDCMRVMLRAGAEVDAENDEGVTPLRLTLSSRPFSKSAIELLISHGADIGHEKDGVSVREFASRVSHGDDEWVIGCFNQ